MERVWNPKEEIELDKSIKPEDLKSVVFTKIGDYEDEPLWWVLKRNKENDDNCGKFWWGFNRMKIMPELVQKFVKVSKDKVWLVMAKTYKQERLEWRGGDGEKNAYRPFECQRRMKDYRKRGKDTGFSAFYKEKNNEEETKDIPKNILTGGNIALIAKNLKQVDFRINLCSYKVRKIDLRSYKLYNGDYLCSDKYNKQNDTYCATFENKRCCSPFHSRQKQIYFVAEMCDPYCVYLYDD